MGKEIDDPPDLVMISPPPLNGCFIAYLYFIGALFGAPAFTVFALWATEPGPGQDASVCPLAVPFVLIALVVVGATIGLGVVSVTHLLFLIYRSFRYRRLCVAAKHSRA
jgi:hypothetical protein